MSMGIGSTDASLQFLQRTRTLSQQTIQMQQDNREQAANSVVTRAGQNIAKNQQIMVEALQQENKRASAIDMYV